MTKEKVTPKDRPEAKRRQKPLDVKTFIITTRLTILNRFNSQEQNVIVKELYFAVRENRQKLIDEHQEQGDILGRLNEEIPVGN